MADRGPGYFQELTDRFGRGWNRFWFRPSDPYPLGVIRVCIGLLALYFQLSFTPDLVRWFGDGGMLPPSLTAQWNTGSGSNVDFNPGAYSFLSYVHTPNALYAVHAASAAVLLLMTIGLLSRVTSVAGFVVVLSYINRAPMITSQVETILAMLMFYLCFAPSGAAFSVDRWLAVRRAGPNPALREKLNRRYVSANIVLRLMQVHLALAYLMMGLAKVQGPWEMQGEGAAPWQDPWGAGQAVWLMIARPYSPWLNLTRLRAWPYLINAWTRGIELFELVFPVLIWNRLARPLLLGIAIVMWGALATISGIAPFSVAMLIGNLAYCSPEFLRRVTGASPLGVAEAGRAVAA